MPADGISAAVRLERRSRHVPSRRAALDKDYTMLDPAKRGLVSGGTIEPAPLHLRVPVAAPKADISRFMSTRPS